jgi:type IV secretory pathway VirB10-like protein
LLIIQDLKAKRTEFFAHQGSTSAKNDGDAFLQNVFLKEYEEKFVNGLYVKIVSYLNTEFRTGLLEFEKPSSKNPSPRAYDPEAIKSGARNIAQEEDEELEEQKEERMPQAPFLGRKEETERRGKREGREPMERQEGEKRRKDKEARKEERPRDREEEEDARKRKDAERDERRERERRRKDRERREEQDSRDREDEDRSRGGSRRGDERGHRKSDGGRNESESRRGFRK